MGKRSNFERKERDFYPTPPEAVVPLSLHLPVTHITYWEPCAGDGALMDALPYNLQSIHATDIEPRRHDIDQADALEMPAPRAVDFIITNPPWDRKILHPMIEHFAAMKPTWLLFDADWMHTKQSEPYMKWCRKIVSVGRVRWIKGSPHTGKDNCAWYLFDREFFGPTEFVGRL